MSSNQKSRDGPEALAAAPVRATANNDEGNNAPSGGAGNGNGEGAESGESNAAEQLQLDDGTTKGGDRGTNNPVLQAAEGAKADAAQKRSPAGEVLGSGSGENVLDNAAGAAVGDPGELAPKLGGGGSNVENPREDPLAAEKQVEGVAPAVVEDGGNPERSAAKKKTGLFDDSSSDEDEEGGEEQNKGGKGERGRRAQMDEASSEASPDGELPGNRSGTKAGDAAVAAGGASVGAKGKNTADPEKASASASKTSPKGGGGIVENLQKVVAAKKASSSASKTSPADATGGGGSNREEDVAVTVYRSLSPRAKTFLRGVVQNKPSTGASSSSGEASITDDVLSLQEEQNRKNQCMDKIEYYKHEDKGTWCDFIGSRNVLVTETNRLAQDKFIVMKLFRTADLLHPVDLNVSAIAQMSIYLVVCKSPPRWIRTEFLKGHRSDFQFSDNPTADEDRYLFLFHCGNHQPLNPEEPKYGVTTDSLKDFLHSSDLVAFTANHLDKDGDVPVAFVYHLSEKYKQLLFVVDYLHELAMAIYGKEKIAVVQDSSKFADDNYWETMPVTGQETQSYSKENTNKKIHLSHEKLRYYWGEKRSVQCATLEMDDIRKGMGRQTLQAVVRSLLSRRQRLKNPDLWQRAVRSLSVDKEEALLVFNTKVICNLGLLRFLGNEDEIAKKLRDAPRKGVSDLALKQICPHVSLSLADYFHALTESQDQFQRVKRRMCLEEAILMSYSICCAPVPSEGSQKGTKSVMFQLRCNRCNELLLEPVRHDEFLDQLPHVCLRHRLGHLELDDLSKELFLGAAEASASKGEPPEIPRCKVGDNEFHFHDQIMLACVKYEQAAIRDVGGKYWSRCLAVFEKIRQSFFTNAGHDKIWQRLSPDIPRDSWENSSILQELFHEKIRLIVRDMLGVSTSDALFKPALWDFTNDPITKMISMSDNEDDYAKVDEEEISLTRILMTNVKSCMLVDFSDRSISKLGNFIPEFIPEKDREKLQKLLTHFKLNGFHELGLLPEFMRHPKEKYKDSQEAREAYEIFEPIPRVALPFSFQCGIGRTCLNAEQKNTFQSTIMVLVSVIENEAEKKKFHDLKKTSTCDWRVDDEHGGAIRAEFIASDNLKGQVQNEYSPEEGWKHLRTVCLENFHDKIYKQYWARKKNQSRGHTMISVTGLYPLKGTRVISRTGDGRGSVEDTLDAAQLMLHIDDSFQEGSYMKEIVKQKIICSSFLNTSGFKEGSKMDAFLQKSENHSKYDAKPPRDGVATTGKKRKAKESAEGNVDKAKDGAGVLLGGVRSSSRLKKKKEDAEKKAQETAKGNNEKPEEEAASSEQEADEDADEKGEEGEEEEGGEEEAAVAQIQRRIGPGVGKHQSLRYRQMEAAAVSHDAKTPNNHCSPGDPRGPAINKHSRDLEIRVTRQRENCMHGNTTNLLLLLESDESLPLPPGFRNVEAQHQNQVIQTKTSGQNDFKKLWMAFHKSGYQCHKMSDVPIGALLDIVKLHPTIPMLLDLHCSGMVHHTIGVLPVFQDSTKRNAYQHHIVDGSHPMMKSFPLNKKNIQWCRQPNKSDTINHVILFFLSRRLTLHHPELGRLKMNLVKEKSENAAKSWRKARDEHKRQKIHHHM